ncbi:MAG: alpha-amylase, partial [Alloprevotella sp.]
MKYLCSFLLALLSTLGLSAQGWPSAYEGVMLQGFYWDSFVDSRWSRLESQSSELSRYFNLIWV